MKLFGEFCLYPLFDWTVGVGGPVVEQIKAFLFLSKLWEPSTFFSVVYQFCSMGSLQPIPRDRKV